MEFFIKVNKNELISAIRRALEIGYEFLPHDRIISETSEHETIRFITTDDLILQRIYKRKYQDWFHLVRNDWRCQTFSTTMIHNQYRGDMEIVDQRSWGPYIDLQIRRTASEEIGECELTLHLYPRFWEPAQKREWRTPEQVKKDFSELRSAMDPQHNRKKQRGRARN
jgi:hypothetical protein